MEEAIDKVPVWGLAREEKALNNGKSSMAGEEGAEPKTIFEMEGTNLKL